MTSEPTVEPRTRRARSAATEVAIVMVGVALVSVFAVAVFNYVAARDLMNGTVEGQLRDIVFSRASRIENGIRAAGGVAATVAADKGVVRALRDLRKGFRSVDESLEPSQTQQLRSAYDQGIASLVPPGVEPPPTDELLPHSERAQYLQYWYIAQNPAEQRSDLNDAGDGSAYSTAHARHHPSLRAMAEGVGVGDMLLIDAESESVVYSVDKRIDFATDLARGPHSGSALATAVLDQLKTVGVDEAVLVDFEPYTPAGGDAVLFVASAIYDEGDVVGAVALEVPNALLNDITTAEEEWEATGLGATGEVYVVGADALLRSDSRLWLEDQEAYLEALDEAGYDQDVADQIVAYGSTVLAQPVDTEASEAALDGDEFMGVTTDYLDREALTVAVPLDIDSVGWAAVAHVTTEEAYAALGRHVRALLILAAVLVPAVTAFAVIVSRRLLRPIASIEQASRRVNDGALDVTLPSFGRDEFGDISAKLKAVIETLQEQEAELQAAEAETTEMLMAVMPSQLAEEVRRGGRSVAEAVRNATLIAVRVAEPNVGEPLEQETVAEHTVAISAGISDLARDHEAQLLQSTATEHLYATGLTSGDESAAGLTKPAAESQAAEFAADVREWIRETSESTGLGFEFRGGLAAGDVVAGVVGTDRIAFTVWGVPRRRAVELASVAEPGMILVDEAVAAKIADGWLVEPMTDLVDLKGDRLDGWRIAGARSDE